MITIVSGLPRSGTSLTMPMPVAGGEAELMANDPSCITEGQGKVLKLISRPLRSLPSGYEYRVVFMQRPLPEVLASQDQMRRRRGTYKDGTNPAAIAAAFEKHLKQVYARLNSGSNVRVVRVPDRDVPKHAAEVSRKVADFPGIALNIAAMSQPVDSTLYRIRTP